MIEILVELLHNAEQIINGEALEHERQLININEDLNQINELLNRSLNKDNY